MIISLEKASLSKGKKFFENFLKKRLDKLLKIIEDSWQKLEIFGSKNNKTITINNNNKLIKEGDTLKFSQIRLRSKLKFLGKYRVHAGKPSL